MIRRKLSFTSQPRSPRQTDNNIVQYALMRTDLASMTIGRVAAQAMHVANKMTYDLENWQEVYRRCDGSTHYITGGEIYLDHTTKWFNPVLLGTEMYRTTSQMAHHVDKKTDLLTAWEDEAGGFGTAIVLAATARSLTKAIEAAWDAGLHANLVTDPEYYVQDGASGHIVPDVLVGGYIFGRKMQCEPFTEGFKLLGMY